MFECFRDPVQKLYKPMAINPVYDSSCNCIVFCKPDPDTTTNT